MARQGRHGVTLAGTRRAVVRQVRVEIPSRQLPPDPGPNRGKHGEGAAVTQTSGIQTTTGRTCRLRAMTRRKAGRGLATRDEHAVLARAGLDTARSLEEAIEIVQGLRARPILIDEHELGEGISGLWLATPVNDHIIVNPRAVLFHEHRQIVVAHELMHILEAVEEPDQDEPHTHPSAASGTLSDPGAAGVPSVDGVAFGARTRYDDPTERRVESLACALMMLIRARGGVAARLTAMAMFS